MHCSTLFAIILETKTPVCAGKLDQVLNIYIYICKVLST